MGFRNLMGKVAQVIVNEAKEPMRNAMQHVQSLNTKEVFMAPVRVTAEAGAIFLGAYHFWEGFKTGYGEDKEWEAKEKFSPVRFLHRVSFGTGSAVVYGAVGASIGAVGGAGLGAGAGAGFVALSKMSKLFPIKKSAGLLITTAVAEDTKETNLKIK